MAVTLGSDSASMTTAVPNLFIDEYMADANGEYVKIYLYLMRCMNSAEESISISKMADKFDHTEKDIKRALRYWEKVKLLRLEFDEEERLTGIYLVDTTFTKKKKRDRADSVSLHREEKSEKPTRTFYSRDDIDSFGKDAAVQELIFVAESLFGRTLSQTDLNTILYWYDDLAFSPELIEYLIEYCTEGGHKSVRYMEKVALSWKENGITTVDEAKQAVRSRSRIYGKVVKSFGITGRGLAESELSYVDKWKKDYKFTDEMIVEACRRTIDTIASPSFDYADAILSRWKEKKLTNLKDVEAEDENYRRSQQKAKPATERARMIAPATNKFNNFEQRTYNFEQLEEQLMMQARQKA